MALSPSQLAPHPDLLLHLENPNSKSPFLLRLRGSSCLCLERRRLSLPAASLRRSHEGPPATPEPCQSIPSPSLSPSETPRWISRLAVSTIFAFVGLGAAASAIGSSSLAPPPIVTSDAVTHEANCCDETVKEVAEDEDLKAALEAWRSKTYALTVPLRIIALRGSIPPSWIKDFVQAQGKRMKLNLEYVGSLESIFSKLTSVSQRGYLQANSAMAADIISLGDSWLSYAISGNLIEPLRGVEEEDWYKGLSSIWKVHMCRNAKGELDQNGCIWGVPYRWGSMVIAYKKNKFKKHNLSPIQDWGDLWRPELAGKISMIDSSREVIGAVLKHMGSSYNTLDIDSQVSGGRSEVLSNLTALQRQVRLFDSVHYLKAFNAGDVWVAVGWSSDVIPVAKRMSDVSVVVPNSGTSLWADLWAVPYATRFSSDQIGGRVRSSSPLTHQWLEFCLQTARELPFKQEVVPGASPLILGHQSVVEHQEHTEGRPKLDTNLIDGVPPPEILAKCEFLGPLSNKALEDHRWLISQMQKPGYGLTKTIQNHFSTLLNRKEGFCQDPPLKHLSADDSGDVLTTTRTNDVHQKSCRQSIDSFP